MSRSVLMTSGLVSLSLLIGGDFFVTGAYATDSTQASATPEYIPFDQMTADQIAAHISILEGIPKATRGRKTNLSLTSYRKRLAELQNPSIAAQSSESPRGAMPTTSASTDPTLVLQSPSENTPLTHLTKNRVEVVKKNLPQSRPQKEDVEAEKSLLESSSDKEAAKRLLQTKIQQLEATESISTASYIKSLKALLEPAQIRQDVAPVSSSHSTQPSPLPTEALPSVSPSRDTRLGMGNIDVSGLKSRLRSPSKSTQNTDLDASIQRLNAVVLMMGGSLSMFSRQQVNEHHDQYLEDLRLVEESGRSGDIKNFAAKKATISHLKKLDPLMVHSSPARKKPTADLPGSSDTGVPSPLPVLPTTTRPNMLSAAMPDTSRSGPLIVHPGSSHPGTLIVRPEKDAFDHIKDFFLYLGSCFISSDTDKQDQTYHSERTPLITDTSKVDEVWDEAIHGRVKGPWNPVTPERHRSASRLYAGMPIPDQFSFFPDNPSVMSQSGLVTDSSGQQYSVTATLTVVPVTSSAQRVLNINGDSDEEQ